jgi:carboxyl-terminal processing protease
VNRGGPSLPRVLPLFLLAAWALLASAGCGSPRPEGQAAREGTGERERISATAAAHFERTLDELVETLEHNYVYGARRGVDWTELRDRYRARVRGLREVAAFAGVARALVAEVGDPEVVWQSRDERIQAELEYSTRYEGIGTYIAFRERPVPRVLILEVIPGSPAERAGLLAHDAVLAIDGAPVRAGEGATVASRMRGPRGTEVRLVVSRPAAGRLELAVARDHVDLSASRSDLRAGMVGTSGVAYLQFPRSSTPSLAQEVPVALERLRAGQRLVGLLLDLRVSGSGSFPVEELLATFASGRLGAAYTASGSQELVVDGADHAGSQSVPLAVLVGPDTEGAAEILAGALQSVGRALIVGARTPGSVEREQQFGLVDGSRLWAPVWSYRAAGGREIGVEGVEPELAVGADWDAVSDASDAVRLAAARALVARGAR